MTVLTERLHVNDAIARDAEVRAALDNLVDVVGRRFQCEHSAEDAPTMWAVELDANLHDELLGALRGFWHPSPRSAVADAALTAGVESGMDR